MKRQWIGIDISPTACRVMAKGDQATVKVGDKRVMVHCIEIRESSVVISIEGIDGTRELKLP